MNFPIRPPLRPKVCFLFIGHRYQILHGASVAAELARSGLVDVHVAGATAHHVEDARRLVEGLGAQGLTYHRLWRLQSRRSVAPKLAVLALNLELFARFDAIVVPERTSLLLRWMGLRRPLFIHTDHGAGDRAVGYENRIREFDLVLLAGEKQRRRMKAAGIIREGEYAVVGYPKFDLVDSLDGAPPTLFAEPRPVVLYNPHFHPALGSWRRFGLSVLEQFAASPDYNLIFAPHMRLFDGAPRRMIETLSPYLDRPNIHIDLGGERSRDMTYTRMADVYLGDVSSQVYEFLRTPRPCLFLSARRTHWAEDENYAHWRFGPVLERAAHLCAAVDTARRRHPDFIAAQTAAFADTFDLRGRASQRAAEAILARLASRPAPAPHGYGAMNNALTLSATP